MTGIELKNIREDRFAMSQRAFAVMLHVHVNTIGRWERGERRIPFTTAWYIRDKMYQRDRDSSVLTGGIHETPS